MTTIQRISREDAIAERDAIGAALRKRFSTDDRDELRQLSLAGAMSDDDTEAVERLRSLDFLLSE